MVGTMTRFVQYWQQARRAANRIQASDFCFQIPANSAMFSKRKQYVFRKISFKNTRFWVLESSIWLEE